MKKIFALLLLFFLISLADVKAVSDPSIAQCLDMGYQVEPGTNGSDCVFGDGNSCNTWEFYRGECGAGYARMGFSTMYTIAAVVLIIVAVLVIVYFKKLKK